MCNHLDLATRRRELGLSQEAVAAAVGLHLRNYGILERRWPCPVRAELRPKLAAALRLPLSALEVSNEQ